MSATRSPVMVTPKTFWESRTQIYNTVKGVIAYVTAILTMMQLMLGNGTLPFSVDAGWLLFIIAVLAITDTHVSLWLRSTTEGPIVKDEP